MNIPNISAQIPQTLDCIGQVLQVGDVIMPTNDSSLYGKPQVVTRIGASCNVQINGDSYANANMVIKINEQYVVAKGQQEFDMLIDKYKPFFNHTPVETKKPTPQYLIMGSSNYTNNKIKDENIIFSVIKLEARTGQEEQEQLQKFIKDNNIKKDQNYFYVPAHKKKWDDGVIPAKFGYDRNCIGIKKLKELQMDVYIDSIINPQEPIYAALKELYLKKAY